MMRRAKVDLWWSNGRFLKVCLKPFQAACETKSPKLANTSLASLQKLLTRFNLKGNGLLLTIKLLEQVSTPILPIAFASLSIHAIS